MDRYVCIHGHFYQPPRENPWLETIEIQDSAYPYHDWNERITEECYTPNASSRILDERGRITQIVNNYSRISFNVGPTLLAWMQAGAPSTYQAILEADRRSAERFSGHGSAMAQPFNHMILPLANHRDKVTQVRWGLRDFEARFGRKPEGMWLPETAVDLESLDVLAAEGIRFTVLAPYQARRVRPRGRKSWREVSGGKVDPTRAYEVALPSGRTMALFFYDGPVSRSVAFEQLLHKGEDLAHRLLGTFSNGRDWPQLVHIATDGETYGHHHRHGEMALSFALDYIESNGLARLTNYGEYLERHPPELEVEIHEDTSWSCSHGIGRWRENCGCNSGGRPGWNQEWRAPLRRALDRLRDAVEPLYEDRATAFLRDPWAARDDYIDVVLDRSPESKRGFLEEHATRTLSPEELVTTWKLLEIQRHAMLMYTSCGWFFDELSGIETVQVIQYAGRAVQLSGEVLGQDLEPSFLGWLQEARSNIPDVGDGRAIYERSVRPARLGLSQVGAHYALSSLIEEYPEEARIYCYTVRSKAREEAAAGRVRFAAGHLEIASEITGETEEVTYGVLHLGDHNLNAGVRRYMGGERYRQTVEECKEAFSRADFMELLRLMNRHFDGSSYAVKSLFRDEQRKVLDAILESTLTEVEEEYQDIYDRHVPLMRFLAGLGNPLPRALRVAAEFLLNTRLRRALEAEPIDPKEVEDLLEAAQSEHVPLDTEGLSLTLRRTLKDLAARYCEAPWDLGLLREMDRTLGLVSRLPFDVDLSHVQNGYYQLMQTVYAELKKGGADQPKERKWLEAFEELGRKLSVQVA